MRNLRLVYDNMNGERKDITLPMEKWIADWWYECNIVPQNDLIVLYAEVDGEPILNDPTGIDGACNIAFREIAWYLEWDDLHAKYIGVTKENKFFGDNSADFEKWLNITQ